MTVPVTRRLLPRLALLQASFAQERSLLELFVEHAPAAIAMFDCKMCYMAASRRWRTDYGLTEEFVGRSHYEVFPEISEAWKEVHRRALTGEVITAEEDEFDRADGSVQWVSWEVRPWRRVSGVIGGIVIAAVDVTERVTGRKALEAAHREAESANRAKDEFLAMLGHELRNPLAPITTALHLMRLRPDDPCHKERQVIERQMQYMVRLIEDLLDISRIAQGKIQLKRERTEVSAVVGKAIELGSTMLESARHTLHVEVPSDGLLVDVDPTRMTQVVSNLLVNAIKYTQPGGQIHVDAKRQENAIVISVTDNGPGIPKELLARVFDRFTQGKQGIERSQGGLGLGLSIVRSLVELHQGSVFAESEVGRGSKFVVSLPPAPPLAYDTHECGSVLTRPGESGLPIRVLVVDDNRDAADVLGWSLEELGYETCVAYDPPQALELARSFHPEAAFLDIGLPVMDGYELARRLKSYGEPPAMLVAVTGYGQENDRKRAVEAGFDAHLIKPIAMDDVSALLEQLRKTHGGTRRQGSARS